MIVREFKIALNAPAQRVFFPGSEVSRTLVVEVNEPKSNENIQVTLFRQGHVSRSTASAPITLNVELPCRGFYYGDIITLKVTLENGSNRQLRLRAQLLQVIVYTAQGHHIRLNKIVVSNASCQLEPRTTSTWNPDELVVPGHIKPTLTQVLWDHQHRVLFEGVCNCPLGTEPHS